MLKRISRTIARFMNRTYAPFVIVAQWHEGRTNPRTVHHFAWSMEDALDWLECYAPSDAVSIHWRSILGLGKTRLLAARIAV